MSNQNVYEFRSCGTSSANRPIPQFDVLREFPDVPVLSGTLLSMELVIGQRAVDLAQVSQLVLSDLGATLQILREAGSEAAMSGGSLKRVEDCISWLGLEGCLEVMAESPISRSAHFAPVFSAWDRAREIAVISRFVAENLALDVAPEDAYLVGLLHDIGNLPQLLKWDSKRQFGGNSDLAGLRIAEAWRLPHCIVDYFQDRVTGKLQAQWTSIVDRALELLESRPYALLRDEFIALPFAPSERYELVAS